MTFTAIIDCGYGNLHSVLKAFERLKPSPDWEVKLTTEAADLKLATHIVLPGVGAFADVKGGLDALPGMRDELEKQVLNSKKPFFGICVGMQILAKYGHEFGKHEGLGWFDGEVVRLESNRLQHQGNSRRSDPSPPESLAKGGATTPPCVGVAEEDLSSEALAKEDPPLTKKFLKIPHMGWNELSVKKPFWNHPVLDTAIEGGHAYFVHSYHMVCDNPAEVAATTDYGGEITAIIARDNIIATQFHPEKSQEVGMQMIRGFMGR